METVNLQPQGLQDNLVIIRPLVASDMEALFKVAADPLIWEQHPVNNRYKREVFQPYFDEAVASESAFVIIDKATGELIGSTRYYEYRPDTSCIAIGYTFLSRKYWGGSYNRSMKMLLINYAFTFAGTVIFHIGISNVRSQKAILKIGAKKTGETAFALSAKTLPHFEYRISKQEWNM